MAPVDFLNDSEKQHLGHGMDRYTKSKWCDKYLLKSKVTPEVAVNILFYEYVFRLRNASLIGIYILIYCR